MEIQHRVVIITGGSSGLGAACVQLLKEKGAQIVVWDQQPPPKDLQHDAFYQVDVAQEISVREGLESTLKQFGAIHGLVQCAGIIGAGRMVGREGAMPLETFKHVLDVNLVGTFNVMRLVAEEMMKQPVVNDHQERGVIVNTASIAAYEGQIGQVAYSASKGGVVAMTLPIARELARVGIRVNTIAPGLMETPMLGAMSEDLVQRLKTTLVFPPRLGTPQEYAALVCHMFENTLMNGEVIRLDGAVRLPIQ
jgi:NAD(P)-dependent dehydrogenase (short-subunit alcohol dehydrogenase family)